MTLKQCKNIIHLLSDTHCCQTENRVDIQMIGTQSFPNQIRLPLPLSLPIPLPNITTRLLLQLTEKPEDEGFTGEQMSCRIGGDKFSFGEHTGENALQQLVYKNGWSRKLCHIFWLLSVTFHTLRSPSRLLSRI